MQTLVANGHHWSSIKLYTLSEVGTFFRVVILQSRQDKVQKISELWQGNNLTLEGLKQVLKSIEYPSAQGKKHVEEPSKEEVQKDWNRLASFMSKLR